MQCSEQFIAPLLCGPDALSTFEEPWKMAAHVTVSNLLPRVNLFLLS